MKIEIEVREIRALLADLHGDPERALVLEQRLVAAARGQDVVARIDELERELAVRASDAKKLAELVGALTAGLDGILAAEDFETHHKMVARVKVLRSLVPAGWKP